MSACCISADVYRRLWLLYLIERFGQACMGAVRLQKVAYFAEEGQNLRLFIFRKAPYGPFSEELRDTLDQLQSMDFVVAEPLGKQGNRYRAVEAHDETCLHARWLEAVDSTVKAAIDKAHGTYGYMKEAALVEAGHRIRGFGDATPYDVLLTATAPELVPVALEEDECEEIALSLSPAFVGVVRALADTDWASSLEKVPLIEAG